MKPVLCSPFAFGNRCIRRWLPLLILTIVPLSFARKAETAPGGENLTIVVDGPLYPGYTPDKEKQLPELKAGESVKRILARRTHMYKIELSDGRKGWVEPYRISVAETEKAIVTGRFDLKDSTNLNALNSSGSSVDLKKSEWAQVLGRKPGWVHIHLNDGRSGWVMETQVKYPGQVPSGSIGFLHHVLAWLVRITGGGFFSSIIIIALYILPPTLAFYVAKLLSIAVPVLPNIILKAVIVIMTVIVYFSTFFTVLFASPMGNESGNALTMILFVILTVGALVGIIKRDFYIIKVRRCPSCKKWTGAVYDSEQLSQTTVTTTTTYESGLKAKDTRVTEHWKDYCVCSNCNHTWSVHDVIKS